MKTVILVLMLICCFVLSRTAAQVLDDGEIHTFVGNWGGHLYNNPWGEPTTVNIIEGPSSYTSRILAFDDSIVNISGGHLYWGRFYDNSRLNFSGGLLANVLDVWEDSQVTISGGEIGRRQTYTDMVQARDHAHIFISGGIIYAAITMNADSRMDVSGGQFVQRITVSENSRVSISGGQITSHHGIWVSQTGTVTFHGCGFMIDGLPIDYGTYSGEEIYKYGNGSLLTGTLKSAGALETRLYVIGDWARIVFVEEPVCCPEYPAMDFNEDCKVNLIDFVIFAQSWLDCNLAPETFCWE